MIQERIAEIAQRLNAVSAGKWRVIGTWLGDGWSCSVVDDRGFNIFDGLCDPHLHTHQFVAHAKDDLRDLLAENAELRATLAGKSPGV